MLGRTLACFLVTAGTAITLAVRADTAGAADAGPSAVTSDRKIAYLAGGVGVGGVLPAILSEPDIVLYRQTFRVQERGDWKTADRLIRRLGSHVLIGHVLAQRYLHPTKYRSTFKELKAWMAAYADHPDARRIYKLALRRKPKDWRAPKRPDVPRLRIAASSPPAAASQPPRKRSRAERRDVGAYRRQLNDHLANGYTLAAKKLLRTAEVKRLFTPIEYDRASVGLGRAYLADGRDEWALSWAGRAADRSGDVVPEAHWTAGLAAWRLDRFPDAARHFEAAARAPSQSPWMISAAAFWAARASLVGRRPHRVTALLNLAARHQRTFYGLLARRVLGLSSEYRWSSPPLATSAIRALSRSRRGQRALALIQVGQMRRAELELRAVAAGGSEDLALGVLALAARAGMPALAMRLESALFTGVGGYDAAAYPVPQWTPTGGFRVDRALIYALIRRESRFNPKAKSTAGARGLMQLMPRTASFVAGDRAYRSGKRSRLFRPELNLTLGQRYLEILLADAQIDGDLLLMVTAWNGGPGNLRKWRRDVDHMGDPLFFIETIPSRETRIFVERVLANLWIYRDRLGQPTPSLDSLAAGDWPAYTALDGDAVMVAEYGHR